LVVANAVVLGMIYFVELDRQWRSSCAASFVCRASVASTSYSPFTMMTTLFGSGLPLTSPPTLDWLQLLVVVLAAFDGYAVYQWARRGRGGLLSTAK
jgi:hypothetical protein